MWLPSVIYTADEEKPKVNGHQSSNSTAVTASTTVVTTMSSQQQPSVMHSEPSLLSLINDSPPPAPLSSTGLAEVERRVTGEPQFPPPPPSPSSHTEQSETGKLIQEPPPFRLHVIKDTVKSLDARYQVLFISCSTY